MVYEHNGWSLPEAMNLLQRIQPIANDCGLHVGICGSVLYKGESKDDLDLVVFPLQTKKGSDFGRFQSCLEEIGFASWKDATPYHPDDSKLVVCSFFNFKQRVDWFIFDIDHCDVDK